MEDARVRGDLLIKAVQYINKKWGKDGLDKLCLDEDSFLPDKWYGLDEFCSVLDGMYSKIGITDPKEPYRMGKWMVTSNDRWAAVFQGKDPAEIFSSNKNQKLEYVVGDLKGVHTGLRTVSIHTSIWTTDKSVLDLWSEFYRGRLKGVLILTGKRGEVQRAAKVMEEEASCTYIITWY